MRETLISAAGLGLSVLVAGGGFIVSTSLVEHRVSALEKVVNIQGIAEYERWRTGVDFRLDYLDRTCRN